jgi:jasmonate O-methyltransferase
LPCGKALQTMNWSSPEYKIFFTVLPENDFSNIFKSFGSVKDKSRDEIKTKMVHCYFFGVPNSFYGKVFSDRSLHFVHSSYSLHWLSKVILLSQFLYIFMCP